MSWFDGNRRRLVTAACAIVLIVGIVLVWFRIRAKVPDNMIHEVSARETKNSYEVLYRTHRPFHVRVQHSISDRWTPPPGKFGVFVGSVKTHREETVLDVPARYDWIHGDYYLVLRVDCSSDLVVAANREAVDVPIWSGAPLSSARFGGSGVRINGRRLAGGDYLGSGCGWALVGFDADADTEECLDVYPTLDKDREE
jgi:hypothetical protein